MSRTCPRRCNLSECIIDELIGFEQAGKVPMRGCAICEIRIASINTKVGLTQTNTTQLLLSAMYPDSGD